MKIKHITVESEAMNTFTKYKVVFDLWEGVLASIAETEDGNPVPPAKREMIEQLTDCIIDMSKDFKPPEDTATHVWEEE